MKDLIKKILKEEIDGGLGYIDTHYNEMKSKLEKIKDRIKNELPLIGEPLKSDGKLKPVNYKDLESWSTSGKSDTLTALADKLIHMIDTGKSHSIKPMLKAIVSGRIKKLKKPDIYRTESLGKGHFRWNNRAYTLTNNEIEKIKQFFNL